MRKRNKHFIGKSRRMPESKCTGCGKLNDAATPIDEEAAMPNPGDVTVCLHCGNVMAFADDLSLRDLTDAEQREAAGDARIMAFQMARGMLETKQ
jgi:hypothetical protein